MSQDPRNDDRTLHEQFQDLRREDASRVPTYEAIRAATPRPGSRPPGLRTIAGRLAWSALGLLVIGSTLVLWTHRSTQRSVEKAIAQARELQAWSAPTDFLLPADLAISVTGANSGGSARESQEQPTTQPNNRPD
jgi:anti-sigma factor RsiW